MNTEKYLFGLDQITDIDDYLDTASDVLLNLSEDIRESDEYDTDPTEGQRARGSDYVIKDNGLDLYEDVKSDLYTLALEKFPGEVGVDIVEPIEPV